jgi:flavin reductase (DIM6/NTAB) family NADH-FMN oxidoreductase RutF
MNAKVEFPLDQVYRLLEPGPVVLVTTTGSGPNKKQKSNIMPMSWHQMMEFVPPLVGCVLSNRNHSFQALCQSGECVLNIPTAELAEKLVKCGNATGARVDKFKKFGLTPVPAGKVKAPMVAECYASLECKVSDTRLVDSYNFFVLEVVQAWIDPRIKRPKTLHHEGEGLFIVATKRISLPSPTTARL